ncbi:O-antigen ligase family protein [Rubritalea sp.]|uniref:O-antigen ligase family protein n=1 Tax=Rubritalea sp. TaxID=2109375 RepID=UPI003EF8A3B8
MPLRSILIAITLLPLAIGPWWLGSYYGEYRWPLIYATWIAVAASFLLKGEKPDRAPLSRWTSLFLVSLLASQGLWMLHNAWGHFIQNEIIGTRHYFWEIIELDSQPSPLLPGTVDKREAWDRLSYIIPGLCYFLALRRCIANRALKLSTLCGTLFWTGVSIALLGLAQRFTEAEGFFWNKELFDTQRVLFFATFRSPGIASCYLNLCLSVGLSHLLAITHELSKNKHATPTRPLCIGIGIIGITAAAMSAGSKAGAIFTAATLFLWLITNFRAIWRLIKQSSSLLPSGSPHERNILAGALLGAMVLTTLSFGGLVSQRWEQAEESNFNTLTQRHLANHSMIEMLETKHPRFPKWEALGYGPGSFMPLFPFFTLDKGDSLKSKWVYAHNDHLETLIEWGWLGTTFWILLIGGSGFLLLYEILAKNKAHTHAHLFYFNGAAIGMFIFLLHATVDFPFQIESIAISFAAVMSIGWAATSLRRKSKVRYRSQPADC